MKGQYLNIHYRILKNPYFTSDEKLILAEIVALCQLKNGCTAGDEHFIEIINKSRPTVNKIIKKFERVGLIVLDVKKGIGKKTKLVTNFEELLMKPFGNQTNMEVIEAPVPVELPDTTCRDSLQVGVETEDTTCREGDTTITLTNTDILIHQELQYTGGSIDTPDENLCNQHKKACLNLNELVGTNPEHITNPFLKQFQECCAVLYLHFGPSIIEDCYIFKSNQELYEIYGSSNFYEVRSDLTYVRENMDRFLRYSTYI